MGGALRKKLRKRNDRKGDDQQENDQKKDDHTEKPPEMVAVMATISTALTVIETVDMVMKAGKEFMKKVTTTDIKNKKIPVHCDLAISFKELKKGDNKKIPVHCDLAVSFKGLNKGDVKAMDDQLKVMIAGSTRAIGRLKDVSWKSIVACMNQNGLLKIIDGSKVFRADKLIKNNSGAFDCFQENVDAAIVKEVVAWFRKLISDPDVIADTKIDIKTLAQIVATTGTAITAIGSIEEVIAQKIYVERNVVDIGILRYPSLESPFFKLYRIELKAWRDSTRILFIGHDTNGISGVYNCLKYEPRDGVIKRLSKKTMDKGIKIAEDLFA